MDIQYSQNLTSTYQSTIHIQSQYFNANSTQILIPQYIEMLIDDPSQSAPFKYSYKYIFCHPYSQAQHVMTHASHPLFVSSARAMNDPGVNGDVYFTQVISS